MYIYCVDVETAMTAYATVYIRPSVLSIAETCSDENRHEQTIDTYQ